MKGQILDYSEQDDSGIILDENGIRYHFSKSDWKEIKNPLKGINVDFESLDERALNIYYQVISISKKKSSLTLWAIFLGGFGAHKFYMKSWGWGIVYLLFCWTYIPTIVSIIEWIRYILISDIEFNNKLSKFKNKPFGFFW